MTRKNSSMPNSIFWTTLKWEEAKSFTLNGMYVQLQRKTKHFHPIASHTKWTFLYYHVWLLLHYHKSINVMGRTLWSMFKIFKERTMECAMSPFLKIHRLELVLYKWYFITRFTIRTFLFHILKALWSWSNQCLNPMTPKARLMKLQ